jgi:hypothetical protein
VVAELRGNAECAVLFGAGRSEHALDHLELTEREDGAGRVRGSDESGERRACDGVGEIARADEAALGYAFLLERIEHRVGQFAVIERIAGEKTHSLSGVAPERHLATQESAETLVDLAGQHASATLCEGARQSARSGTDLEDESILFERRRSGDRSEQLGVDEEVLAKALARLEAEHREPLTQLLEGRGAHGPSTLRA